jgi:hypothetical protein
VSIPGPQPGDVIIRATISDGFVVVDAITDRVLAGPALTLTYALAAAQRHSRGDIWQQQVDGRGRPLGQMFRLMP